MTDILETSVTKAKCDVIIALESRYQVESIKRVRFRKKHSCKVIGIVKLITTIKTIIESQSSVTIIIANLTLKMHGERVRVSSTTATAMTTI